MGNVCETLRKRLAMQATQTDRLAGGPHATSHQISSAAEDDPQEDIRPQREEAATRRHLQRRSRHQ